MRHRCLFSEVQDPICSTLFSCQSFTTPVNIFHLQTDFFQEAYSYLTFYQEEISLEKSFSSFMLWNNNLKVGRFVTFCIIVCDFCIACENVSKYFHIKLRFLQALLCSHLADTFSIAHFCSQQSLLSSCVRLSLSLFFVHSQKVMNLPDLKMSKETVVKS